jgi:mono/diheme cytochrome c family protein
MSAIQKNLFSTAVGTALALFAFGCGEQSDAPTPPKPAEAAPAPPPDEAPAPPAPPAPAEVPDTPPAESAAVEADVKAGKADYEIYCASCHGKTGAGDGPLGQVLNPKPARHDDGAYMEPWPSHPISRERPCVRIGRVRSGAEPRMNSNTSMGGKP